MIRGEIMAFKPGNKPWNTGKKLSAEHEIKMHPEAIADEIEDVVMERTGDT